MATLPILPNNPLVLLQSYGAVPQRNLTEEEISQILDNAKLGQQTPSFSERLATSRSTVPESIVIPGSVRYPSEVDPTAQTVTGSPYVDRAAEWFQDTFRDPINRTLNTSNAVGDTIELGLRGAVELPYKYFTGTSEKFSKTKDKYLKELSEAASLFNNGGSRDWQGRNFDTAVNLVTLGMGGGAAAKAVGKGFSQLVKAAGQKELAETFYKNAGELAARNAAGAFPETASGVSRLTKQYVTQGNRALENALKAVEEGKKAFVTGGKDLGAIALGEGIANAVNATEDQTSTATDKQLNQAENNIVENIVNPVVRQDTGYSRIPPEAIVSNPVSVEALRAAGLPDITPALPETTPNFHSARAQDLLRLLQETPMQNSVPITTAQAAQEYQQALRDRNTQGLTREEVLRQAMDKRQKALARINAERESNPLSWFGHILSLASAWRRREFNPSATWSNATLAQAALDPEYQEAEDTIRLLAPQYATSQQNLENIQKSAFGADRLATDALNAATYQDRVKNEEGNTQARLLQAIDPYKNRSLEELQAMRNVFLRARAAQKTEAGQQRFDTVLKDIDRSIALKSQ